MPRLLICGGMIVLLGALLLSACDMLSSGRLEKAVLAALAKDTRTSEYKFEVSAQPDGAVLITGEVWGGATYDAVTEIVKAVPGVTRVTNNCKVEEQGSSGLLQDEVVPSPFL